MAHPLLSLLIRKPDLVMEHLSGYAALAREEATSVGGEVAKRAAAWAVALVGLLLFLIFAGVGAMLGVMLDRFHWVLVLVPGAALAVAVVAFLLAREKLPHQAFAELRSQIDADAQTLRTLGAQ